MKRKSEEEISSEEDFFSQYIFQKKREQKETNQITKWDFSKH